MCGVFVRLKVIRMMDGHSYDFPVTQAEVADPLGLSTVHVKPSLMSLRADSLIGRRV